MTYLLWIVKAILFFTLFAFALNNQQDATVHFFFGQQWTAPLVLVVLMALTIGIVVGVLGMVPIWLKGKQLHMPLTKKQTTAAKASALHTAHNDDMGDIHGV